MLKGQKNVKIKVLTFALLLSSLVLNGCDDVQWFKTNDGNKLIATDAEDMKIDTYYVKQNTKFYEIFNPELGASKTKATQVKTDRIIPLFDNEHMLPTHYMGELVAYRSYSDIPEEITLERYKDLGYSLGAWGGVIDEKGYFYFDKSRTCVEESSLGMYLEDASSKEIRIVSINGEAITADKINTAGGVLTGFSKDEEVTVQMFIGTNFAETTLKADTQMLQAYELYSFDSTYINFSSYGYVCFNTPKDLKSGYYKLDNAGLMKYYSHERKDNVSQVNMNESYFESERERVAAYSKQYTIDVNTKIKDLVINVPYSIVDMETESEDVNGYVYSPSGTQYLMKNDIEKGLLSLTLTEAELGEWTINISPKTIETNDISVESTKVEEEATLKKETFVFTENTNNILFEAFAKGEDEVYGYIVSPDGRTYTMTYDFDKNKQEGRIYCELPFASAGSYEVKVYYHPTTTELSDITMGSSMETETDIIYIN